MSQWIRRIATIASAFVLLFASATAFGAAGGVGHGYPPSLHQLEDAAMRTAAFNVLPHTVSNYPSDLPFQVLYSTPTPADLNNTGGIGATFHVQPGTRLFVPVIFNDNSLPIIGNFPPAGDRAALLHYIFSQDELGVVYARITIDGETMTLGPAYVVEVAVPTPLPDGATLYQDVAAILTPLGKGTHTVEISALATGHALSVPPFDQFFPGGVFEFDLTYTVVVQ